MVKDTIIQVRVDANDRARVQRIARILGVDTMSAALRALIRERDRELVKSGAFPSIDQEAADFAKVFGKPSTLED